MLYEALLIYAAGLALGFAIGFAIAWALGGKTREELARYQARAEEQENAAAEKLELVANAKSRARERVQGAVRRSARQHEPNLPAARDRISSGSSRSARTATSRRARKPSTRSCSRSKSR